MAPIRVALVGLSSNAATSWASSAHLPYLLSPAGRARFEVVALLNSSTAAAQRAAATYGLPAARAYGTPEELAADPDVQLVVVCTRVDNHAPAVLPAIRAGKDVLVEWPLADTLENARELARFAREAGVRAVVGLQVRVWPGDISAGGYDVLSTLELHLTCIPPARKSRLSTKS